MSQYPLRLKPRGGQGLTTTIGITLKPATKGETEQEASKRRTTRIYPHPCPPCPPVEECVERFLPVGADMFADAPAIEVKEMHDILSLPTFNRLCTVEEDEPEIEEATIRSVWWKFFVPAEEVWFLSADTKFSFWERGDEPDTQINVYYLSEPYEIGDLSHYLFASDSATDNSAGSINYSFGRMTALRCRGNRSGDPEGTWFYIQVYNWHNEALDIGGEPAGVAYVLRVSFTQIELGLVPPGEEDPDVYPPDPEEP